MSVVALFPGQDLPHAALDLARPIAGAPLLVRQLEWLHSCGVEKAYINRIPTDPLPAELREQHLSNTGLDSTWIPSSTPLTWQALALRAGLKDTVAIVVPHTRLGNLDLRDAFARCRESRHTLRIEANGSQIEAVWIGQSDVDQIETIQQEGWLTDLASELSCHELTEKILMGDGPGIVVRGTETNKGVWVAHGALVVDGARVLAPCYLGADSFVATDAQIGPGAVLGDGCIVEQGAVVIHSRVGPGVVVGQRLRIEDSCAMPGRICRHNGRTLDINDPLLLGKTRNRGSLARLAGVAALSAIAPASILIGGPIEPVAHRLWRVVDGTGSWLGVRKEDDPNGVVMDLLSLMVPPSAQQEERDAAAALYLAKKSIGLDLKLILGWLAGAPTGQRDDP